jgi:hypothetical protein
VTTAKLLDAPDANIDGNACATPGGMQSTMQTGDLMLCKGPDGAQHWYKYDAERSTVANPVLIFVGP